MVNSVKELQELIIWLKSEKVKSLKIGDIHVELSDYALLEGLTDAATEVAEANTEAKPSQQTWTEQPTTLTKEEEEELFWSTR